MDDRVIDIIGSGKGGEAREPVEAENDLISYAQAHIIEVLGEGPIDGLVVPSTGSSSSFRSIYLDDTPLKDPDGDFNFKGVQCYVRNGYEDQNPVKNFGSIEAETIVNQQIIKGTPITQTLADGDFDDVRIKIMMPSCLRVNKKSGDIGPTKVQLKIWAKLQSSGTWKEVSTVTIQGKTNTSYEKSVRVKNITQYGDPGPWEIKIERLTSNSGSSDIQNDTYWSSYTTVLNERFLWPNIAYVAMSIDAKQFGTHIPARSYEVRGRIVRVPSNMAHCYWDADDPWTVGHNIYNGAWDGTFKWAYSNDPAWCFYDIVTNSRYGLGASSVRIDKYQLYSISKYCLALDSSGDFVGVDNGEGGKEPRFTLNICINTQEDAYHLINALASGFMSMPYWAAGYLSLSQDGAGDATHIANETTAINGEFHYSGVGLRSIHSVAAVTWNDPRDSYKSAIEMVEDPDLIASIGWKPLDILAVGCTSQGQAHRIGRHHLEAEAHGEVVAFIGSFYFADCVPGSIIKIQDKSYSGVRFGGRVLSGSTTTSIKIDDEVTLAAATTYTLTCTLSDGSIESKTVTNAAGAWDTLVVGSAFSHAPGEGAFWVLSGGSYVEREFRCLSNIEKEKNEFEITAIYHDSTKYARIDYDIEFDDSNTYPTRISIRNDAYKWVKSGSGTNEYYLLDSTDGNPDLHEPSKLIINGATATKGTIGSLAAGRWGYGDNDSLNAPTIYVRLSDGTDPDTKAVDYIMAKYPRIITKQLMPPTNMDFDIFTHQHGRNFAIGVLISWKFSKDPRVVFYDVDYRESSSSYNGSWKRFGTGETTTSSIEDRNIPAGTYDFRIRARGVGFSDWYEEEDVVIADPRDLPPDVTNLVTKDDPATGVLFVGKECEVEWDDMADGSVDYYPEDRHRDYRVKILTTGDVLKRTKYIRKNQYVYTENMNKKDFGTPAREFKVSVECRDTEGRFSTNPTVITVSKTTVDFSGNAPTLTGAHNGIEVDLTPLTIDDQDLLKMYVYCDTSNPPVTLKKILSAHTKHVFIRFHPTTSTTYYVKVVPYDMYGAGVASDIGSVICSLTPIEDQLAQCTVVLDGGVWATGETPDPRIEYGATMLAGYSDATTKEWWLDASTGKCYFGQGEVCCDANGISFNIPSSYYPENAVNWGYDAGSGVGFNVYSTLYTIHSSHTLIATCLDVLGDDDLTSGYIYFRTYCSLTNESAIYLDAYSGLGPYARLLVKADSSNVCSIEMIADASNKIKVDTSAGITITGAVGVTGATTITGVLAVTGARINLDDAYSLKWGDGSTYIYGSSSTDVISFYTAGAKIARFGADGLGIGKDADSGIELDVYHAAVAAGTLFQLKYNSTSGSRYLIKALNSTPATVFSVEANGDGYFLGDCSALTFTDRTAYPKDLETAIAALQSIQRLPEEEYDETDPEKQLNHELLHDSIKSTSGKRDLGATVSVNCEILKYLLEKVTELLNPN